MMWLWVLHVGSPQAWVWVWVGGTIIRKWRQQWSRSCSSMIKATERQCPCRDLKLLWITSICNCEYVRRPYSLGFVTNQTPNSRQAMRKTAWFGLNQFRGFRTPNHVRDYWIAQNFAFHKAWNQNIFYLYAPQDVPSVRCLWHSFPQLSSNSLRSFV